MSSEAGPSSLVLVRRSAGGTVEWIPLESPAQHVAVAAADAYTLIDRANYEAPQTLVVERVGKDLVVEVHGHATLVLDGFFTAADVEFYPTTNIAAGAGPLSGPALNADSAAVAHYSTGAVVLWSADQGEPGEPEAVAAAVTDSQVSGGSSPLLWVGLAAGGLGLAALAGGGGGSGGGESGGSGGGGGGGDTTAPQITSGATAPPVNENSGAGQVVYRATATDATTVTYSLKTSGDAGAFDINANTGAVTLAANPNFETKQNYSFTVVATDVAGNHSERAVSLAINNLDEVAPTITSGDTATPVEDKSGPNQLVYTVTSTDTADISTGPTTYSLKPVGDSDAFKIDANTGAVTLIRNPDFDKKSSFSFTVVATDAAGNDSERAVSLAIINGDGGAPNITSGGTASPIAENSGAGRAVYTATATDASTVTYSLKTSGDAGAFHIDRNTGAVTLTANPNFETKPNYSFTVVATDVAGNHSERAVSLAINNLDEVAPTITSGGTASPIEEKSGPNQIVYTVTSTDTADIHAGNTTYSLKPVGDSNAFRIDNTGAVTLIGNPDFEKQSSYSFTVVATDAAHNSSERAISLRIIDVDDTGPPPDTTSPTLSASTPTEGAKDVSVEDNIVLVFSEKVRVGSGTITLVDHGDEFTIDVNDGSQVSVSGNRVTINPDSDLNSKGNYHVQIDAGAFTDLAGNPFAGGDTLHFMTADDKDHLSAALDGGRAFQIDASPEIDIRGATLTAAATDGAALWSGSANLGSDARVMLVGIGPEVSDPSALENPIEAAIAWQSEPNGIIEGNSTPVAHDAVESHVDTAHLPIAMATSQGLV